jgi:hypothetical protein
MKDCQNACGTCEDCRDFMARVDRFRQPYRARQA